MINKVDDNHFVNIVKKHYIITITETWLSNEYVQCVDEQFMYLIKK